MDYTRTVARTRRLTADLSAPAYNGWQTFAAARGLTMTALVESLGLQLAELEQEDQRRLPDFLRRAIGQALIVRAERGRRRPPLS